MVSVSKKFKVVVMEIGRVSFIWVLNFKLLKLRDLYI